MKKTIFLFDTETTGLILYKEKKNQYSRKELVNDLTKQPKIVQIGGILLEYDTETKGFVRKEEIDVLFNPGVLIPEEATKIHRITNDMVKDKKEIKDFLPKLDQLLNADYIVCHNGGFDLLMIKMELERLVGKDKLAEDILLKINKNKGIAEGITANNDDSFKIKTNKKNDREKWILENIENNEKYKKLKMSGYDLFPLIMEFGEYGEKFIDTMFLGVDFCQLPSTNGFGGKYKWPNLTELHTKIFGVGFEESHNAFADIEATEKCFITLIKTGYINL